jgi:anti-sigma factor RsiW
MTPRAVACQEFVELITDYLEGELPPDQVAAVEHHLDQCPPCQRYLAQIRTTIAALGYLPLHSLSDDAYDTLLREFRQQ